MSASTAVCLLFTGSILASLFIGPEVGLFIAVAATAVAISAALDSGVVRDRRAARRRNQAHRIRR